MMGRLRRQRWKINNCAREFKCEKLVKCDVAECKTRCLGHPRILVVENENKTKTSQAEN